MPLSLSTPVANLVEILSSFQMHIHISPSPLSEADMLVIVNVRQDLLKSLRVSCLKDLCDGALSLMTQYDESDAGLEGRSPIRPDASF